MPSLRHDVVLTLTLALTLTPLTLTLTLTTTLTYSLTTAPHDLAIAASTLVESSPPRLIANSTLEAPSEIEASITLNDIEGELAAILPSAERVVKERVAASPTLSKMTDQSPPLTFSSPKPASKIRPRRSSKGKTPPASSPGITHEPRAVGASPTLALLH